MKSMWDEDLVTFLIILLIVAVAAFLLLCLVGAVQRAITVTELKATVQAIQTQIAPRR